MEEFRLLLTERMNAMIREREEDTPRIYQEAWEEFAAQVRRDAASEDGDRNGNALESQPSS
jgi:hypothetical protein